MTIVDVDDSFKRPGTIPFSWEIRPGVPKTRPGNNNNTTTTTNLLLLHHHPHKKLSPLRLKPLSHSKSQPLLLPPPALSPPSSSFISNSKTRSLSSPLTPPSFSTTPSKLKPPPPSHGGFYSPGPSFRSSPRAFSERWQNRVKPEPRHDLDVAAGLRWQNRVKPEPRQDFFDVVGLGCFPKLRKKNKNGGRQWDNEYCSDMEMMSPWTVSSRRSVSPRWDSPKSSFSSLRIVNEAEWVGFGLF
ncbi:hypothetical protein AALP_AA2G215700 [Arabis alpina]|uniref:Uncharacterized protein n=1 Tax=Arabis alpina TaxID=50452 RepID=A0A087HJ33_ARAAL|nr:hypothetical protein AALP_AA2G215700 [Arabis alpina]